MSENWDKNTTSVNFSSIQNKKKDFCGCELENIFTSCWLSIQPFDINVLNVWSFSSLQTFGLQIVLYNISFYIFLFYWLRFRKKVGIFATLWKSKNLVLIIVWVHPLRLNDHNEVFHHSGHCSYIPLSNEVRLVSFRFSHLQVQSWFN